MHKSNTQRMSCLDSLSDSEMSVYANVATSSNGEAEWEGTGDGFGGPCDE
jgi:hypothetical protein